MTQAVDAVQVGFIEDGGSQIVNLPEGFTGFPHIKFGYLTYCLNYKNVQASFNNVRLYLTAVIFITLTDGLYDIADLNSRILNNAISGRFYKIQTNTAGTQWSIYSYTTAADGTNDVNGVQEDPSVALNSGNNLNRELYDGTFGPDRIKLYGRLLDVHGNMIQNGINVFTGLDYVNVPITVSGMNQDTLEFKENMIFESRLTTGNLQIKFEFRDKLDGKIYFTTANAPELLVFFERNEDSEHVQRNI